MVEKLDSQKFQMNRYTDYIAYSLIYLINNFNIVFKQVYLPIVLSILILVFLYISLSGEFNLDFFISSDGKIFISVLFFLLIFNLIHIGYQSFKIVLLQNLNIQLRNFKIKILFMTLLKLLILTSIFLTSSSLVYSIILSCIYIMTDNYFYQILFNDYLNISAIQKNTIRISIVKLFASSLILLVMVKFFVWGIPVVATFSIFFVNEFIRILITKSLFFYAHERILEMKLFTSIFLLLIMFLYPVQYFCMLTYYKMKLKRENQLE